MVIDLFGLTRSFLFLQNLLEVRHENGQSTRVPIVLFFFKLDRIAQILFFVFLVIFVIALVMGVAGRRRPPI